MHGSTRGGAPSGPLLLYRFGNMLILLNRDRQGAATKANCSAAHPSGGNCFPPNTFKLFSPDSLPIANCRFQDKRRTGGTAGPTLLNHASDVVGFN